MATKQLFKLAVQIYLETRSFQDLEDELGVGARLSTDGRRVSLNYDQISSKPGEIVDQCRGLVVRALIPTVLADDSNWKSKPLGASRVVAYPFKRFYNYGDNSVPLAVDLKDSRLRVEEKVDGTLCIVYRDDVFKKWCVATRSVPDADLPISIGSILHPGLTFRLLFERAVEKTLGISFDDLTELLDSDFTWIFELVSPVNKVVVEYNEGIVLLGCRSVLSGKEQLEPTEHIRMTVPNISDVIPRPACHSAVTIEEIIEFVKNRPPKSAEGVVLVDSKWNRSKIKNPGYVAASKTRDVLMSSRRNMIEYILAEKIDDMIPYMDAETLSEMERTRAGLVDLFSQMDQQYKIWKSQVDTRKGFAELVSLSKYDNKPFFELWEKKFSSTKDHYVRLAKSEKISSRALDHLDHMTKDFT